MKLFKKKKSITIGIDELTAGQIVEIQLRSIVKYCGEKMNKGYVTSDDVAKIGKMFKILHGKK